MFTKKDLSSIDSAYFIIISAHAYRITLESHCTHHQWHITGNGAGGLSLMHRHHPADTWHTQKTYRSCKNLHDVIEYIKEHDTYTLSK